MELHLNKPTDETIPAVLDFHRFVLLFTHSFSDRLRFVGELELEHAVVEGLEEGGELELEQAYIDFLVRPSLNFRAGMMLVPVGIINERHEPPVFHGVERPFVDTVIVPTTWFEAGAGVHGSFGPGFRYRAYAMAPLDATAFSAEEGLQGSAQHGSEAVVRNVALTGRLEYVGTRGLQTGVSFWAGDTSFNVPRIDTSVGLYEFDARLSRGRLEARGQLAHVFINGAGALNDAMGRLTGIDPNIAEQLFGVYGEVAYRFLPASVPHDAARVRPLRELRHPVQDARGLGQAAAVRSRRVGDWRHVLGRSRRGDQVRLFTRAERERDRPAAALDQRRSGMVVLNMTRLVLLLVLVSATALGGQTAAEPRVIHVAAERFTFTPSDITVDEGSVVELRLTSDDTDHGFRVHGLGDPNVLIPKRGRGDVRVTIDAKAPGDYPFECSHVCGAGHGFMRGVIRVKPRSGAK